MPNARISQKTTAVGIRGSAPNLIALQVCLYLIMGNLLSPSVLAAAGDCIEEPCQVATNVADRLIGEIDLRPNQFGLAQDVNHDIEFSPPERYRTRITKIHGDFIAVFVAEGEPEDLFTLHFDPTRGVYEAQTSGYQAGLLTSIRHTGPEGSPHGFPLADNAMIYRQDFLDRWNTKTRFGFSQDIINGLLRPDNILRIVHAIFNNTSGRFVQMETTLQIQFLFEPIQTGNIAERIHSELLGPRPKQRPRP